MCILNTRLLFLGFFTRDCITEVAWHPEAVLGVSRTGTEGARPTHKLSRREETQSKKDTTTYKVYSALNNPLTMPQRTTYWKPKTRPNSRSRPVQGNLNWSFSGIVRQRPLQKRYRGFLEFLDILSQVLSVFRGILPHSSMLSRSKGGPRRPLPCPETWEKLRKAL